MTIPTRDEALATLDEGQAALKGLLARLSDEETARPATIGGGDWSAKDLLGHVAFWGELAVQSLDEWRAGRRPFVEQISDRGDEGIDAANAQNQARTAAQSLADVRARAAAAHTTVIEAIRVMSDDAWLEHAPFPNARRPTLAERLGSTLGAPDRPFGHAFAHLPDLEAYVESLGRRSIP